jgi:thioredoxin 1
MSLLRRIAIGLAVVTSTAGQAVAQVVPKTQAHQETNEEFMGVYLFLLIALPIAFTMFLAIKRGRSRPKKLPEYDDANFETEVLQSPVPVLVHFGRSWNVANAAALSQTELLQWQNRGAVTVGVLEIDSCPEVMARFPGLVPPAYLLFYEGRKLFHRAGLRQADEIQDDIDRVLSREGF